jgi:hypothetical protein
MASGKKPDGFKNAALAAILNARIRRLDGAFHVSIWLFSSQATH